MGNTMACMPKRELRSEIRSKSKRGSQRKMAADEEQLHRQALAMAIHQHQLSQRFDGSMSRRIGSTSSRRRTLSDPFSNGKQVPVFPEKLEAKKVVLIHGEGFGAWCWYKIIPQLEEVGLCPVALDLTGCGIDHTDTNSITTLADYAKPLIDYLHNLSEDEKVILVGHSCGGASISYALELYPKKIAKAIFVCATMVMDGQRPFDVFAEERQTSYWPHVWKTTNEGAIFQPKPTKGYRSCCSIHEADPTHTNHGEALPHSGELWERPQVLHPDTG